nr:ionotropic receptor 75a-like isoform X1 [Neodiprion pinetum]
MYLSIFLTFAQLLASVTASIDQNELSNLIIDYIDYKNASRLFSAFLCLRDLDSVSLSRKIMNASISATIFNPSKICGDRESLEDLLRYNYHSINIATDLDCESSKELLMGISAGKMFNHSYSWLLTSNNKSDALAFMGGLNLSVDADVVVAITAEETVKLYDIFNTGSDRNGTLNATFIGTWRSLSPRLNIFKLQSPVYRRQNLTGITLKFAAVTAYMDPREDDPIKYLSNPANRSYDTISKINYALGVIPRDFFNYSVEISTWFDYGGRWNGTPFFGMMGALGRREADFTLGGTVVTQERLEYCTPVVQNYPFWTGFLFKHPASHSVRNVFLEPLSPSTWNAVIVLSFLVTVVLSIGTRYHRQENGNPWSFGIYSTLATLFQQGGDLRNHRCCEPRLQAPRDLKLQLFSGWHSSLPGHSGHLLFIVFTLFSMLLYNFYSASVVSSLLSDPPQNIRTIGDLLNFGMPSAYENASYVPHYFKISTVPAEKMFYEKMLLDKGKPKILPRSDGIRRVKEGAFAYHTTPADAYEEIAQEFAQPEICSLAEIPFIRKSVLAMWASRENPYREHLKIIHRRLQEVGILAREQKRWLAPKPECLGSTAVINSLALNDVAPAFLGLLCGTFAAVFIFALELAHRSLKEKGQATGRHRRKKIRVGKQRDPTTVSQRISYSSH